MLAGVTNGKIWHLPRCQDPYNYVKIWDWDFNFRLMTINTILFSTVNLNDRTVYTVWLCMCRLILLLTVNPTKVNLPCSRQNSKVLSLLLFFICVCRLGLDAQSTISFDTFVNHFQNNEVGVLMYSKQLFGLKSSCSVH